MLKHTTEGHVMKPVQDDERGKKEIEFYEDVFLSANACSVITHLRDLVPRYLGLHQFISDDSGKINVVCFILYFLIIYWFLVNYFIKMEDVASGCRKPCIADIKIGRQTWDPDSSPEKRLSENVINLLLCKLSFKMKSTFKNKIRNFDINLILRFIEQISRNKRALGILHTRAVC